MRQIKILEITSFPPPRTGWGVRVELVKKELERRGHECIVLNTGPSRKLESSEYECVHGAIDFLKKIWKYSALGFTIHSHVNGDSPKGMLLALSAQITGLAMGRRGVVTFHAGPDQIYFPRDRSLKWAPVLRLIFSIPYYVVCNNEIVKRRIVEYGIAAQKIVPIAAFSKQYLTFQEESPEPGLKTFMEQRDPLIATYLICREEFHVQDVMQSLVLLKCKWPGLGVVIIGAGDSSAEVQQLAQDYDVNDSIFHAGSVSHNGFMTILQRSRLYLRSHSHDGVCSSVLQALSLGVPVVAADDGIRPESVVTYPVGEVESMADTMHSVLRNRQQARAQVAKPPVRDTVAEETNLLVQVAGGNPKKNRQEAGRETREVIRCG